MEHMILKAVTTARDQGVFEAVISSSTIDREKDTVDPGGMVRALQRWIPTGKMIPLAWMHSTRAEDQIGYIDPSTARVVGHEVVASGWIDQTTERGKGAWRLVKSRTLGFSFGYLVPDGGATERKGGGRDISELDVFEVTATTVPMHNDTRVLGWKSAAVDQQRMRADAVAREAEEGALPPTEPVASPETAAHEPPQAPQARPVPDAGNLRRKAAEYERELLAEGREREAARIPDVPPTPTEASQPEPAEAPDTEEQWRKAVAIEREQAHEARRREERDLPAVPPAPPEPVAEPTPSPKAIPETQRQKKWARRTERREAAERRRREAEALPAVPSAPAPAPSEPEFVPDGKAQRRKAAAYEREVAQAERHAEESRLPKVPEVKVTAEPFSASHTSNWVARGGGLPHYIQHIAHDLVDGRGMDESHAIATAIAIAKRWAAGGKNVHADTQAKASAAVAEWEKLKASHSKAMGDAVAAPPADLEALASDIADAELADIFELLCTQTMAQMPDQTSPPPAGKAQDEKARKYEREAERAMEEDRIPEVPDGPGDTLLRISSDEMDGLADGSLKSVWSAAAVNNLPDSAFLYVAPGGKKDTDGKTIPRSLRSFPVRGPDGSVDLPHLRNALARIPQSNLSPDVKDKLTAKAQSLLAAQSSKAADVTDDAQKARSVDPLRQRAESVALEYASGGESLRKPPQEQVAPKAVPEMSLDDLKRKSRDEMLVALSGLDEV